MSQDRPPEQSIHDLERAIIRLQSLKSQAVLRKTGYQNDLAALNARVRGSGGMPPAEYKAICRKQNELKAKILEEEGQLATIKTEVATKSSLKDEIKRMIRNDAADRAIDKESVGAIQSIRDKYVAFASDTTRVSSMRAMAAQFVQDLDAIIRSQP